MEELNDLALMKHLLIHDNFIKARDLLSRDLFEGQLQTVYDLLEELQEKYKTDISIDYLKKTFRAKYPTSTSAARNAFSIVLDNIEHEQQLNKDFMHDLVVRLVRQYRGRLIAEQGIKISEGQINDFGAVEDILQKINKSDVEIKGTYNEVEYDLDTFLSNLDTSNLYKFRLPSLSESVPGIGKGNLGIVFARPEVGKSTFVCYEAAGWIIKGYRVAYFENEEPAYRSYTRIINSVLERSIIEIENDKDKYKEMFKPFAANLKVFDCVSTDLRTVDKWAMKNKPDIIILNQLDKFYLEGEYARDDLRLGTLYVFAREMAKRNNAAVIAVTQCSADGEGLANIDYSMMAGSKTSKAAEADIIIGIGANKEIHKGENFRRFNICKNKINGWHGVVDVMIDKPRCMYNV